MSRLLTPAEISALRVMEPFVPAPVEAYTVTIEAGTASLTPEAVASLEPGSVFPIRATRPSLVEIVANGIVVGYGRLESRDGGLEVRVVSLPRTHGSASRLGRDVGGGL